MFMLRELRKKSGFTMKELGAEIGVAESTISQYETGKRQPDYETLLKLAEFFGVSTDTLLRGEQKEPVLTKKDERDIGKRLEAMIGELDGPADGLMFSGEPLDEETRELLKLSLKNQLEISKRIARQKYTPKKYRKEGE